MNKPQIGLVIPIVQRKYIISLIKQINKTTQDCVFGLKYLNFLLLSIVSLCLNIINV